MGEIEGSDGALVLWFKLTGDEDGGGIQPSSPWVQTSLRGMGRTKMAVRSRRLALGANEPRKGLAALPFSSLLLFTPAHPHRHVRDGWHDHGRDRVRIRSLHIGYFLFVVCEVLGMRREGDEAEYIPNMRTYPPSLAVAPATPGFWILSSVRGGCWARVMTFATTCLVGGVPEREWGR